MNKVPQEVRLIVSREDKGGDWELDRLLAVMHQELDAKKRVAQGNYNPQPDQPFWRNKPHWKGPPSASSLFSKSDSQPTCTYCKQPHSSNSCETVSNAQAHRDILEKTCYVMFASRRTIWAENAKLMWNVSHVVAFIMSASVRATWWKLEQGNNVRNPSKGRMYTQKISQSPITPK